MRTCLNVLALVLLGGEAFKGMLEGLANPWAGPDSSAVFIAAFFNNKTPSDA